MKDKVVLVTGSTDGIGKQTALELARMGARVILHGRNPVRCHRAYDDVAKGSGNPTLGCFAADFSSLTEVRTLASEVLEKFDRLDVLINNAGIFMTERKVTKEGFEMTFVVNHLAPFLLTHLLLERMKKEKHARIVNVSSVAHQRGHLDFDNLQGEKNYTGYDAYALSKLANILFTYELAGRLEGSGITVNCLHPGVIGTKLLREGFGGTNGASWKEGAVTPVFLASSPDVEGVTGKYFVKKREEDSLAVTYDRVVRGRFWRASERLAGLVQ